MDALCSRCGYATATIESELAARGTCPRCTGQISYGAPIHTDVPVAGAVASVFDVGHKIAIPFQPVFVEVILGAAANVSAERTSPGLPSFEIDVGGASASAPTSDPPADPVTAEIPASASDLAASAAGSMAPDTAPDTLAGLADIGLAAGSDPVDPNAVTAAFDVPSQPAPTPSDPIAAVPPAVDPPLAEMPTAEVPSFDAAAYAMAAAEQAASEPMAAASGEPEPVRTTVDEPASALPPASSPPASVATALFADLGPVPEPAEGLPAHLQLPAIDFSIPASGMTGVGASATSAAPTSTVTVDLPAHLQLPNFPQFDLSPLPGAGPAPAQQLGGGVEVAGIPGGSFSAMAEAGGAAAAPGVIVAAPSVGEGWAVTTASEAARPPPRPPPRKAKKKADAPTDLELAALPVLPNVGLPTLESPTTRREPTLIQHEVDPELQAVMGRRAPVVPLVVAGVLLLGLVGGAYVAREPLLAWFSPPKAVLVETDEDRARALTAEGREQYEKGQVADAAKKFEAALVLAPEYGQAHRALAIAYAKLNQQGTAVDHYKRYLALEPTAKDGAEVRKIVEDYEKAKQKLQEDAKPAPAPPEAAPPETKKLKRRGR